MLGVCLGRARTLCWVAAIGIVLLSAPAWATPFAAGSLIIPRDECLQYAGSKSTANLEAYCGFTAPPSYQPPFDSTYATNAQVADDGSLRSYGVAWFLMANGVKVYTIINKTKKNALGCPASTLAASSGDEVPPSEGLIDGRDFCIDGGASAPVKLVDKVNLGVETDIFAPATLNLVTNVIAYRGAPFIVAAADAAKALALINNGTHPASGINTPAPVRWGVTDAAGVTAIPGNGFKKVDIHIAKVGFDAPVLNFSAVTPAILAVGDADESSTLIDYLQYAGLARWINGGAGLDGGCPPSQPAPAGMPGCTAHGKVWDIVTHAAIIAGELMNAANGYRVIWYPEYELWGAAMYNSGVNNTPAAERTVFGVKIREFVDASNSFVGAGASIVAMENLGPADPTFVSECSAYETSKGNTCVDGGRHTSTTGIQVDVGTIPWGKVYGSKEQWSYEDVGHPFVQFGNALYWVADGINWRNWTGTNTNKPGSVRLIVYRDTTFDVTPNPIYTAGAWVLGDDPNDDHNTAMIRHKDNDPHKGLIIYYGCEEFDGSDGSKVAGSRLWLNTMFQIEVLTSPVVNEVTRSSPLVRTDPGVLNESGTFVYQGSWIDVSPPPGNPVFKWSAVTQLFDFPATKGHLRVLDQSLLTTSRQDFDAISGHWDGASQIPPDTGSNSWPPTSAARNVFTATTTVSSGADANYLSSRLAFTKLNVGPSMDVCGTSPHTVAPTLETDFLVDAVRGGVLGGIDRSSPAYVGQSDSVNGGLSPCTALFGPGACRQNGLYVGGLDGMLHGFATGDIEHSSGTAPWGSFYELWAFIPPDQLDRLRDNTARVNSTPLPVDVFGDFFDSTSSPGTDGTKEWVTALFFTTTARNASEQKFYFETSGTTDYHCGGGGAAPTNLRTDYHKQQGRGSVWALDVSKPQDPKPLWVSNPVTTAAFGPPVPMGASRGVVAGVANCAGSSKPMVFVVSKVPGGAALPGFNVYGLDATTGATVWGRNYTYTKTVAGGESANVILNPPLLVETVTTAVSSGVDVTPPIGCSNILFIGDVEGKIWKLNPLDGTDIGAQPYFDADTSPVPELGSCSGGVIKCPLSVIRPAFDSAGNLHLVAVTGTFDWGGGGITARVINLDTANPQSSAPKNPVVVNLDVNDRIFGDPIIYGDDIYLQSSDGDINAIDTYSGASGKGKIWKISLTGQSPTTLKLTAAAGETGMMSGSKLAIGYGGDVIGTGGQGMLKKSNTASQGNVPATAASAPPRYRLWLQNFTR